MRRTWLKQNIRCRKDTAAAAAVVAAVFKAVRREDASSIVQFLFSWTCRGAVVEAAHDPCMPWPMAHDGRDLPASAQQHFGGTSVKSSRRS